VLDYDDSTTPRALDGTEKPGWLWATHVLSFILVFVCVMLELFNLPFRDPPTTSLLIRPDLALPTPLCHRRWGDLKASRYRTT